MLANHILAGYMYLLLKCSFVIIPWLEQCRSSRILLIPFPFKSHVLEMSAVAIELRVSGHDLYILLPRSYPELQQVRVKSGFTLIDYPVKQRDVFAIPQSDGDWIDVALNSDPLEEFRRNVNGFTERCTNPLDNPDLPRRLRQLQFHLAIVDAFPGSRCHWILAHWVGVPYVSLATQFEPWLWRLPALPSFVPFPLAAGGTYTERMTFWERLWNTLILVDWTVWPRVEYVDNSFVKKYLPGETYWTLAARSLLWLVDTNVVIDYPRPRMPNEIHVGGLTTGSPRSLTGDIKSFADSATNGLIIAAFGSLDVISDRFFDEFFMAFFHLSEYHIVWRSGKILMPDKSERVFPSHMMVKKWIPINDLLAHNNTRLFISHCGTNSQFEALYHGVPQICLTVWADHMYNAARMQYHGFGIDLGRMRHVNDAQLVAGARDVIKNRSYSYSVRAASALFRSRSEHPRQTAAWWINHVLVHGGSHLHSYALDMPWYEYLMLDILVICLLLPAILITSLLTGCICCCCIRRRSFRFTTRDKKIWRKPVYMI